MTIEQTRAALTAGRKVRIVVGEGAEDPTLVLWLFEGMVLSEAVAGWSAGVVEPVCGLDSDYLDGYVQNRAAVELMPAAAPATGDVTLPDGRRFNVVRGRRWTRIPEYMSNGQLTARFFVDEATGEVRAAKSWKAPGSLMGGERAAFVRWILELAADPTGGV